MKGVVRLGGLAVGVAALVCCAGAARVASPPLRAARTATSAEPASSPLAIGSGSSTPGASDEQRRGDRPRFVVDRVFAGHSHSCATASGGDVYCWGRNEMGQLGDGTRTDRAAPVKIAGLRATALALGREHTCAIAADKTVACFGYGSGGRIGDGEITDRPVPTPVAKLQNVRQVAAGDWHSCAVTEEGAVWCWGTEANGNTDTRLLPVRIAGLGPAQSVAIGDIHTCALGVDGRVSCWGDNNHSQLGGGAKGTTRIPRVVPGVTGAVALQARSFGACVRKRDGTMWCWGSDSGLPSPEPTMVPGLTRVTDFSILGFFACARAEGTWRCWGYNRTGQVGDGTIVNRDAPVAVASSIADATQVALGGQHACARLADGTAACWGDDGHGQLGTGDRESARPVPARVRGLRDVVSIAAGDAHTCARTRDGAVLCWGDNGWGQLGDGTERDRSTPVRVAGLAAAEDITLGMRFGCARHAGNTVSCWGANNVGELGRLPLTTTPGKDGDPRVVAGVTNVRQIATGGGHACALIDGGRLKCWGGGSFGERGDNGPKTTERPRDATLVTKKLTQVSLGAVHTCGLTESGTALCFGEGRDGQLGDGGKDARSIPVEVSAGPGRRFVSLALGHMHTCALGSDGKVQCWGYNGSGQNGDGTSGEVRAPGAFVPIPKATAIAPGGAHTCALIEDGTVQCWGDGQRGQLGGGESQESTRPVHVIELSGATQIVSSHTHSCALRAGEVWCWGGNENGQLGDGAPLWRTTPAAVDGTSARAK